MENGDLTIVLPKDWYSLVVSDGVNILHPGLYQWTIEGSGIYIGQYKRFKRPSKEYGRNVLRLLQGRPYRLSKPDKFRRIHHELAQAHQEGRKITLTILINAEKPELNRLEREFIAARGTLND